MSCPGLEGVSDPSCRGTSFPSIGAFVCLAGGVGKPEEVPVDDSFGLPYSLSHHDVLAL